MSIALGVSFIMQLFAFDLSHVKGGTEWSLGLGWDAYVVIRMAVAYFRKDTGRDWIIYSILCWTSPLWISAIVYLAVGRTWA